MHDSMGECVRLPSSSSRQNEEGTIVIGLGSAVAMLHGEPLLPIELLKVGRRHRANQIDWWSNHKPRGSLVRNWKRDAGLYAPPALAVPGRAHADVADIDTGQQAGER